MANKTTLKVALALSGAIFLSACDDTNLPGFMQKSQDAGTSGAKSSIRSTGGERDVEAPDVFQKTETGLWDGRPSLGGVWVAHSDADTPERVIVRNQANGKFVIGALFRREREVPGPRFQVSSDAAEALGMLAGAPAKLSVTALRKEVVEAKPDAPTAELDAPDEITATKLDDPIAAATAALDKAEGAPTAAATTATAAAKATPKPVSNLSKPFIQIGIFSVQTNANNTAEALRQAGMIPLIKPGKSNGKDFWRVIVGPATNKSELNTLLKKVKALGFADAYFVTN